ncbi:glycoside hydrolase family 97 protein [Sunxiuqinia sp. sy24]|uniref:glycoside hydrolase family 97 protein n=1 Tax=Sunxiuqinia sp. sy24 TaxID=3461495 RepID=UPI00404528EE
MKRPLLLLFFAVISFAGFAQSLLLKSPDGKLKIQVEIGSKISYSVTHEQTEVLAPSNLSITLTNGSVWGKDPKLKNQKRTSINEIISTPIYKKSEIQDDYNQLELTFKGNYGLIFRAYNKGVAYRFVTTEKEELFISQEEVQLNFSQNNQAIFPYVNKINPENFEQQFFNSFENTYTHLKISEINPNRMIFLPMVVELNNGKKLCFTEADLENYPGLYLINQTGETSLTGLSAPYPKTTIQGGHNELQQLVTERENYIAKTQGARSFPWRVLAISSSDKELLNNDLVYQLAAPSRLEDTDWIKPGKVAWDWWNDWNIYGVDFRAGINNETYKYYIDFASEQGIEYVILDEGWAVNKEADLLQVIPEINIEELIRYGESKNVGIILWAGYWAMDRDLENVCRIYSEMGVKGFKVDFMDRDDQAMVDFYYRCAETAARYQLMIDFHGAYKPTGLQRTYPNVINFEGVFGLEQLKWSPQQVDMVTYDVTMPFIRMMAGPIDYTQGAMRNATHANYRPINSEPMSQGTRCRQLAQYVIFESPFNMLCDNPSNYLNEIECTQFIADIPTVWDQTLEIDGKIGEYILLARQKGDTWYVGGLTNWEERQAEIDLSFLGEGDYQLELFSDGINADRAARDYKHEITPLPGNKKLIVDLKPGGGFAAKITKR